MHVVFLIGAIASGKSSVARMLEKKGAFRIDLDDLSRDVLSSDKALCDKIAKAFGADIIDGTTGEINRALLAKRAFSSSAQTKLLEDLEQPAIKQRLRSLLDQLRKTKNPPQICLVEIPLPNRMPEMMDVADEVVCIYCPLDMRRVRAVGRGMTPEDFDLRAAQQLSDEELRRLADTCIDNTGSTEELRSQLECWWHKVL